MKNNKVWFFVTLFIIASLALVAYSPMFAIELDDDMIMVINGLVAVGFTALAKFIAEKFGLDLADRLAELSSAVAAVLVVALNHLLQFVPVNYESWVLALFAAIVVWWSSNGFYGLFFRNKKSRA